MRWALLVMIVSLAGCDDETSTGVDAAIDSPPSVDAAIDGPAPDAAVRACDGRAYDPCTDTAASTDCNT